MVCLHIPLSASYSSTAAFCLNFLKSPKSSSHKVHLLSPIPLSGETLPGTSNGVSRTEQAGFACRTEHNIYVPLHTNLLVSYIAYAGTGPNVCYTALSSAKQKSATAHCYKAFQCNPCKGGVTNIRACTCVDEIASNNSLLIQDTPLLVLSNILLDKEIKVFN
jgi:hypothetical protein